MIPSSVVVVYGLLEKITKQALFCPPVDVLDTTKAKPFLCIWLPPSLSRVFFIEKLFAQVIGFFWKKELARTRFGTLGNNVLKI